MTSNGKFDSGGIAKQRLKDRILQEELGFQFSAVGEEQKKIYFRGKVHKLKGFSNCGRNRAGGTRSCSWERN